MATFLDLCRRVHRYARIDTAPPGTAPETVKNQEGVLAEIVGWVNDAWADIQNDQTAWLFREASATVTAPAGSRDVDLDTLVTAGDYGVLRPYIADACHRYILAAPQGAGLDVAQQVSFLDWHDWRGGMFERGGGVDATGMPSRYTMQPNGMLRLYPTPEAAVDLTFAYQRKPQVLVEDADKPIMPEPHHDAIVWRALMYYTDTRDDTGEAYKKWERRWRQAVTRLYREQLPEMAL